MVANDIHFIVRARHISNKTEYFSYKGGCSTCIVRNSKLSCRKRISDVILTSQVSMTKIPECT